MIQAKEITADTKPKKIVKVSLAVFLIVFSVFIPHIGLPLIISITFCTVSIFLIYTYIPANKGKYPKLDKFEETVGGYLKAFIDLLSRKGV